MKADLTLDSNNPLQRALLSLDGLSVGDALGQLLSTCARSARRIIEQRQLPGPRWWHTDDSQMAMAIVEELAAHKRIDQTSLVYRFVRRYQADPGRGYGKGARLQLEQIAEGQSWRTTSAAAFSGRGSKGNGGAMRVGPLGAFFADDVDHLVEESIRSPQVTHSHPEGVEGTVAVALTSACVWNCRQEPVALARHYAWSLLVERTPPGEVLEGIRKASVLPFEMSPENAARILGSGYLVTAPDTVPFALWCALRHLDNFSEAMISTLEGDGDCDTNCAIVGSIVSLYKGMKGIPQEWLDSREALDLKLPA